MQCVYMCDRLTCVRKFDVYVFVIYRGENITSTNYREMDFACRASHVVRVSYPA